MLFLKVQTNEDVNNIEYINLDKILTITPLANGNIKILLGAGLYYQVKPQSIEVVELENILNNIKKQYQK